MFSFGVPFRASISVPLSVPFRVPLRVHSGFLCGFLHKRVQDLQVLAPYDFHPYQPKIATVDVINPSRGRAL